MKEEDNINKTLEGIKKVGLSESLKVPENYFDELPKQVLEKIEKEKENGVGKNTVVLKMQQVLAVASVFLVIIMMWHLVLNNIVDRGSRYAPREEGVKGDVAIQEIVDFNETELVDMLLEEEQKEAEGDILDQEVVIEYIYNQNVDYVTILGY